MAKKNFLFFLLQKTSLFTTSLLRYEGYDKTNKKKEKSKLLLFKRFR